MHRAIGVKFHASLRLAYRTQCVRRTPAFLARRPSFHLSLGQRPRWVCIVRRFLANGQIHIANSTGNVRLNMAFGQGHVGGFLDPWGVAPGYGVHWPLANSAPGRLVLNLRPITAPPSQRPHHGVPTPHNTCDNRQPFWPKAFFPPQPGATPQVGVHRAPVFGQRPNSHRKLDRKRAVEHGLRPRPCWMLSRSLGRCPRLWCPLAFGQFCTGTIGVKFTSHHSARITAPASQRPHHSVPITASPSHTMPASHVSLFGRRPSFHLSLGQRPR